MAKKVKKIIKKAAVPPRVKKTHRHHWGHHDFLLVVGGGFLVIVLVVFASESFRMSLASYAGLSRKEASSEAAMMVDQKEKIVAIEGFTYSPMTLTVKKGTTVTWTNNDTETHSATADDGSFNTGLLEQGESGSVTFTQPGTYAYHCSTHPNMLGTVTVGE